MNELSKMNQQTVHSLANKVLASEPKKKSVRVVQEPVTLADGSCFTPMKVETNKDALRASLLMLFKHVADIHVTLVEIVGEKFHLNVDDIHNAITEDPRWQKNASRSSHYRPDCYSHGECCAAESKEKETRYSYCGWT